MKKYKKILTTVILIILTILTVVMGAFSIFSGTSEASAKFPTSYTSTILRRWNEGAGYYKFQNGSHTYAIVSMHMIGAATDVYCVQMNNYTQDKLGVGGLPYKVGSIIKIKGNDVQYYKEGDKDGNGMDKYDRGYCTIINGKTCTGAINNKVAAILSATKDTTGKTLGLGYGSSPEAYRESQAALYYIWDDWVTFLNANIPGGSGLHKSQDKAKIISEYKTRNLSQLMSEYDKLAQQNSYNVNIYYMVPTNNSLQRIILVEREEPEPQPKTIDIPVRKVWLDNNNADGVRPSSVTVKLLANGVDTGKELILNDSNNWSGTFTKLDQKDASGKIINYTIQEVGVPEHYKMIGITGSMSEGYTITNRQRVKLKVIKIWDDEGNWAGLRPDSISMNLYSKKESEPDSAFGLNKWTITLNNNGTDTWEGTFEHELAEDGFLARYYGDEKYVYKVEEVGVPEEYEVSNYVVEEQKDADGNITIVITITNTYKPKFDGYIEITGKVWEDKKDGKANTINGRLDDDETGLGGIKVTLKDANGAQFDGSSIATTDENGNYTIIVNYDNRYHVYKQYADSATVEEKLKTAYVEFEYNGLTYTTVANAKTGIDTSKAIENENERGNLDNKYSTITSSSPTKEDVANNIEYITAATKGNINFEEYQTIAENMETRPEDITVKYCDGTNYEQTNPKGAWEPILLGGSEPEHDHTKCPLKYPIEVKTIKNVNLGLMRREQPDLAIDEKLSKVEVEINGLRYTYEYGNLNEIETNEDGVKVQFQGDIGENNGVYVYRRPVNPSDLASAAENKGTMNVYVTYLVTVANESDTLTAKVNSITNYFDKEYTLLDKNIPTTSETDFNKAILTNLNIELAPNTNSSAIELKYQVSENAIKGLLNDEATLSNAVEIESYSTYYGEKTVYAEQRTGGRTGNPYGTHDKDSHPGNAGIHLEGVDFTYTYYDTTTTYADEKVLVATLKEDDTDIAPSFLLCKDLTPKTLSGTVFEDANIKDNGERLGDGKYDSSTEKNVENVKVELYEVGSAEVAKLYDYNYEYDEQGNIKKAELKKDDAGNLVLIDAVKYTESNGNYAFNGLITGKEYYVKFTYGDDTSVLTEGAAKINGVEPSVNARNYKSTIITNETLKAIMKSNDANFNKYWYLAIEDNYSIAVDDMKLRLAIEDLQYSNFNNTHKKPENMSAYSKSFIIPVEFDTNSGANVENNSGTIGISNNLNNLDFGIIERPREDLFTEKTITNIKITLANGQKLIEGDPRTDNINYVKALGFDNIVNSRDARNQGNKMLLAELDAELIQGAQLDIAYVVRVTNNNEIDYDYGALTDYGDITGNNYITTSKMANYYYYGDKTDLNELKATLQVVDYMSSNIFYDDEVNEKWDKVQDLTTLYQEGKDNETNLISKDAYDVIKEKYIVLQPTEGLITLGRNESSDTLTMRVSKVLTSADENVYNNHAEIIRIDGKTARTIQYVDNVLNEKTYYPGNYEPGANIDEQDDDGVKTVVSQPTGTTFVITYVIAGLVGLILIAGGTIFIKKKVLTK